MQMGKTMLNILPVPTFSWLGVNGSEHTVKQYETAYISADDGIVRLDVQDRSSYKLSVAENQRSAVILYNNSDSSTGFEVNISAADGSDLKLVEVFDSKAETVTKVSAELGTRARFSLVQLYLGGSGTVSEIAVKQGARSEFTADIAYELRGKDRLDLNLLTEQSGRKSTSRIDVRGVLSGEAFKIFKGTIDFKSGASGAKGEEREDVLMLGGSAVNKTVPLILCAEEDVEGSHGASIGRVDEKQVFYMRSRGIPEDKILALLAQSRTDRVIRLIGDSVTEQRTKTSLGRGEEDE